MNRHFRVSHVPVGVGLVAVLVLLISNVDASDPRSNSLKEAQAVASAKLEEMKVKGPPLYVEDPLAFKNAVLDPPFFYYGCDTLFWGYAEADPADLLQYVNWVRICFPVRLEGRILGTINVMEENGRYEVASRYRESGATSRLQDLSRTAGLRPGERVSLFDTPVAGAYFIVEDGKKVHRMAPFDKFTRARFGIEPDIADHLALGPPSRFFDVIRDRIIEARRKWEASQSPKQE